MRPQVRIETITPKSAMRYLEKNTINRKMQPTHCDVLRHEMECGDWRLSNDAICFSPDGVLLNGQHRLNAIVQSGMSSSYIVLDGMEKDTIDILDTTLRARSPADIFAMRGEINTKALVTALHYVNAFLPDGKFNDGRRSARISQPDYDRLLKALPEVRDWVHFANTLKFSPAPKSHIATMGILFSRSKEITYTPEDFFHKYGTGNDLSIGNPILTLRNHQINERAQDKFIDRKRSFWMMTKAWNAIQSGKSMKVMRIGATEKFPLINNLELDVSLENINL